MPLSAGLSKAVVGSARGRSIRTRRQQYTRKSSRYKSFRKDNNSEKRDQLYPHYTPCGCETACGDSCCCFVNDTSCEKYCRCLKSCKNRFKGCCCFAANREGDPEVCRNCSLSCNNGTLEMSSQGDNNYECKNMSWTTSKGLLGKYGSGAFLKKSIHKDTYLGEYTGKLISHDEAEKRGKIYDLMNSSFLFNLDYKLVLDARRKGNKLKFTNHSPNPNCYPKVVMVAGDHRVGYSQRNKSVLEKSYSMTTVMSRT